MSWIFNLRNNLKSGQRSNLSHSKLNQPITLFFRLSLRLQNLIFDHSALNVWKLSCFAQILGITTTAHKTNIILRFLVSFLHHILFPWRTKLLDILNVLSRRIIEDLSRWNVTQSHSTRLEEHNNFYHFFLLNFSWLLSAS